MLYSYQQRTRLLLSDATFARYNDFDLQSYINTARAQVAGEGECIRVYGSLATTAGTQQYPFSAITFPVGTTGVTGVLNVRMLTYQIPGTPGSNMLTAREWEYFNYYTLSQALPTPSVPKEWAQFGQGVNGTIFINVTNDDYTLNADTVCYPNDLTGDDTPEALPKLWQDAVPYYAAYVAMLTSQNAEGADAMFKQYSMFAMRARKFATPSVLSHQYEQVADPALAMPQTQH